MSSKTKIVVLHRKEIIYTGLFLGIAVFLLILYFLLSGNKGSSDVGADTSDSSLYVPGVYTSSIQLNDNSFDVQVTVDANRINSIELVNLSESTTAMYPLMEPSLESLASQIYATQSTKDITYENENKYTSMLLLEAIKDALAKAVPES